MANLTKVVLNTVNANILKEIQKNYETDNLKGMEALFNDGKKAYDDAVSDASQNTKDINTAKNAVKNTKASDKNAQNMAHKRADYVKSGSVLYDVTATGKAKISGNKATISIKDKSGKTGTAVFTYAADGSYTSIITVGDYTTERVADKNGKLRQTVQVNKKTGTTVTNQYDASGKINTQTETDKNKPNWKLTRYFDDNGQKSRNISTDGTKTTTTDFEYDKNGKCITEQIRTYNNSDPKTIYYRTNIFKGNTKISIENNPDGTKITTNYDLKDGKWVSNKRTVNKPVLNTVNSDITKKVLDNVDKNDPKALQAFYNDGDKVYNDAVSDAKTNKQAVQTIQTKIKNESAAKNKNANVVANKKAGGVKAGSSLWGGTATGKATIKDNVATIQIKDKNGKVGTSVYTYASDGSYALKQTIGDTVTERVMDKNGKLRQMVQTNKKTGITVTNEYDATGKINSQTETDKNRPNWTLTRYFDDNGQKSRNISKDGTKVYTTDFEYDKNGKCVTEQIRSYYVADPGKMYYRTNVFDGEKKTSIDNNPDGTKIITNYDLEDGEWVNKKQIATTPDGKTETRTTEGKENGKRLVKVETEYKNGSKNTVYNLQTFDESGKHIKTQIYSDANLTNQTSEIKYLYNKDNYLEKTEVINFVSGTATKADIDAKSGKVVSKEDIDILTAQKAKKDIEDALNANKIDTKQAEIMNSYVDALNNKVYTTNVTHVKGDKLTGNTTRTMTFETLAQGRAALGGEAANDGSFGDRVYVKYNGKMYGAESKYNPDKGTFITKYYDENGKVLSSSDPVIQGLISTSPDGIFQSSIQNNSLEIYMLEDGIFAAKKGEISETINGKNYSKQSLSDIKGVAVRDYTEDDAAAQAKYNGLLNEYNVNKYEKTLLDELQGKNISQDALNVLKTYQEKTHNTLYEIVTETVETKRDDKKTGTIKKGLSLKTFAQAQCDVSNIKIGVKEETTYTTKEDIKDAQGKVVYVKGNILSEAEYNGYINKNPNASSKFVSYTREIEFHKNTSGNMVGFKYGTNTYYAEATFNPEANSDDKAYTVRYWKEDADGNIVELEEDDQVIRYLNNSGPDGIIQRYLRNGRGALYVQNTSDSDDTDTSDVVKNIGGSTVKFARKTAESLTSVSSRYYTEDDAIAKMEYQEDISYLLQSDKDIIDAATLKTEEKMKPSADFMKKAMEDFEKLKKTNNI